MDSLLPAPLFGIFIGACAGYFVRRARLCSFGAIESALMGGDWRRMKVFALALGLAMAGTQLLVLAGWLDPLRTTYVPPRLAILGIALGSLAFGFGMALVGTCAFGSLVRLGGGDLRSLLVVMIFGATAYAALRGILSAFRIGTVEKVAVALPGGQPSTLLAWPFGAWLGAGLALALVAWALLDRKLWRAPRLVTAGIVLGVSIVAGWLVTATPVDDFSVMTRPQSLTFVSPVARAVFGVMIGGPDWFDFGVGSVFGVLIGALAFALQARDFHWEAFDDPLEMRRHILGAVLMGLGGILAGGCTIGQGLTAGSLLAMSWFVSVPGLMLGAWLGIRVLLEDGFLARVWSRISGG